MGARVRQHVNPLAAAYQVPCSPVDWPTVFPDMSKPVHIDIGCGRGHWTYSMAKAHPEVNFVGVEIRERAVSESYKHSRLPNLTFMCTNMLVSAKAIMGTLPRGALRWVTLFHPDPWFKLRHAKRRTLQPHLLEVMATNMAPGAQFHTQTDVPELYAFQLALMADCPFFDELSTPLTSNPFGICTDREVQVLEEGRLVMRAAYVRNQVPVDAGWAVQAAQRGGEQAAQRGEQPAQ